MMVWSRWNFIRTKIGPLAAFLFLTAAGPAGAQTLLTGTVRDAVTGIPMVGAKVQVVQGSAVLGVDDTDGDGRYEISFTPPSSSGALTLALRTEPLGEFVADSSNFQVRNGQPVDSQLHVSVLPLLLATCRSDAEHLIVVGHFRSPLGYNYEGLPGRIAETLEIKLLPMLQEVHFPVPSQPSFKSCESARPSELKLGKALARALKADAFLSGNVAVGEPLDVSTFVSDAYDVFSNPRPIISRSVNLDLPPETAMSADTYASILATIAAGFAQRGNCTTAIDVVSRGEALSDETNQETKQILADLRADCQAQVPNAGLLY